MKVFITGASSGIGLALARHYAAQGASLGLVARRQEVLTELLSNLPDGSGRQQPASPSAAHHAVHHIYPLDVTDRSALAAAARDFMATVGVPDVVIACAGISVGTLSEYAEDFEVFQRIIDTNLMATVATFQPFIAPMKSLASARLVGIASVAGIRGLPGAEAYSASKAAVISYCESLRVELRGTPIKVVTLAPGYIATPMTAHNPYRMPFLMQPERFAQLAARAIARGTSYTVIPWPMGVVAKLLRWLPNALYDWAFSKAQHKPRQSD